MRDLVVILLITLVSTGAALWVLRRKHAVGSSTDQASDTAPVTSARPASCPSDNASLVLPAARAAEPQAHSGDESNGGTHFAVLEFDSPPWAVTLTTAEVMIGRHSQDDVRIPDVRVSRHHAKLIAVRQGGFEIHNLTAVRSEPNPMLVNG